MTKLTGKRVTIRIIRLFEMRKLITTENNHRQISEHSRIIKEEEESLE